MGVHGLTTYLRENTRVLSRTVRFPSSSGNRTPIVIDGWSFVYTLYQDSKLPWVYGGEYPEFSSLIAEVVGAWIRLGLKVYFVFDGACPDLKFPTVITRLADSFIKPALLFFRTSATSRSSARFLHESRILPPLAYATCVHTLEDLAKGSDALEIHYADEEGDPFSVELAGRVGGYVVGNDSDFVILNAPGYRGYIPLDDMVWETTINHSALVDGGDGDDDFQMVRRPKAKRREEANIGRGIVPPDDASELQLVCTSYSPDILASHLNLPVTLLPLLGALVGNDYTAHSESDRRSIQSLFFDRRLSVIQRIGSAAAAMRSILSPTTPRKKNKHQLGSVMDLIDRTVNMLLSRLSNPLSSGEVDAIIDKVVTATLQYAITKHEGGTALWPTDTCPLHDPSLCPFLPPISRRVLEEQEGVEGQTSALIQSAEIRTRFVQAYRRGELSPKLMDILSTGTFWPRLFLETPDLETISRSITRSLRLWIYAILDDSLGLPVAEGNNEVDHFNENSSQASTGLDVEDDDNDNDSGDDELIDVVESDSDEDNPDFLAPLKGALQRLSASDDGTEVDGSASVVSQRSNRVGKPQVTEYVRRGTRIASEVIPVMPLNDLLSSLSYPGTESNKQEILSLVQQSPEERVNVFLGILQSDLPAIRKLSPDWLQAVLAIRWVARSLHNRALEAGSKDREKEKWTSFEARCCLAALTSCSPGSTDIGFPPMQNRNVQLAAQFLATLEAVEHLSQVLLLFSFVPSTAHRFSGRLFHSYLSGTLALPENESVMEAWEACRDGLVSAFREDRANKDKKARKGKDGSTGQAPQTKRATVQGNFLLLAELED